MCIRDSQRTGGRRCLGVSAYIHTGANADGDANSDWHGNADANPDANPDADGKSG